MAENNSLEQTHGLINCKEIDNFLGDAYSLSNSPKTRQLYKQALYSFDRFCLATYGRNLHELVDYLLFNRCLFCLIQFRYFFNHMLTSLCANLQLV